MPEARLASRSRPGAILTLTLCVAGCGGEGGNGGGRVAVTGYDAVCHGPWWLTVSPPTIKVGATAALDVSRFGTPETVSYCSTHVRTVEWGATVSGIVSIVPGNRPDRAVLTGVASGQTALHARVTLLDGNADEAEFINQKVTVVPSSE